MSKKMIDIFGEAVPEKILMYDTKNIRKDNAAIIEEFSNKYADMKHDHQRVTYGSKLEMEGNHLIAQKYVDWTKVKTWLDVGCGCGNFFEYVLEKNNQKVSDYELIKGIEPVEKFVNFCQKKGTLKGCEFQIANILDYQDDMQYDLVTTMGVLQVLDINDVEDVLAKLLQMTKPGGQICLTTTNYDFKHHLRRRIWWSCWAYKKEEMEYIFREIHKCQYVRCDAFDNHGNISELESNPKIFVHVIK